jgi:hypothetical protein
MDSCFSTPQKYAAIKRSINNDSSEGKEEDYSINIFETKEKAAEWLTNLYDFWEDDWCIEGTWNRSNENWSKLYNFFMEKTSEDIIFQWEWRRKGNFRTYRIVEILDKDGLEFYSRGGKLYSFDDEGKIIEKEED